MARVAFDSKKGRFFVVLPQGEPEKPPATHYASRAAAEHVAAECAGTGTCEYALIYCYETRAEAKRAHISDEIKTEEL